MTQIVEGRLLFSFPTHCEATKYDEWEFYRQRFQSVAGGSKAVDILCVEQDASWLIEIKDYRQNQRSKPSDVGDEVVSKVRDTLAGLAAANANATNQGERAFAEKALEKRRWRVVLHLEQQAVAPSPLRPQAISAANVLKKLRMNLKAVDAHPIVVSMQRPSPGTPWTVK